MPPNARLHGVAESDDGELVLMYSERKGVGESGVSIRNERSEILTGAFRKQLFGGFVPEK